MILNTTHIDKEKRTVINKLVGNSFSLWEGLFKNKGSHRMIISSFSENFNKFFKTYNNLLYSNIEIRKKGVIIRISINYKTISWLIPYYKLTIYNSDLFSIHSNGNFIKFRKDKYYQINKQFIRSLINEKVFHSKKFNIN